MLVSTVGAHNCLNGRFAASPVWVMRWDGARGNDLFWCVGRRFGLGCHLA